MPFGADGEHVTVRLIDLEDIERKQYVVTTQYTVRSGANERRADLVLLVNGLPLVVIEAKTAVRSSQSWFDGTAQVHDDYELNVEERGKAALTELFEEVRTDRTPSMVECIVNDIDEIVRHVRFEGWQNTHAGECK